MGEPLYREIVKTSIGNLLQDLCAGRTFHELCLSGQAIAKWCEYFFINQIDDPDISVENWLVIR
jgi:hypothetical protein